MVMRQVCDQLGRLIGQTDQGAKAVLERDGVTNPSGEQLKEAEKRLQKNSLPYCFYAWQISTGMARS